MIAFHKRATAEYHQTIVWMAHKHYDARAIARFIDEIEAIFVQIDANPFHAGKREAWGIHKEARYCGPTSFGFRVRFLPDYQGRPVVLGVISGRRRPRVGSLRRPV